MNKENFFKPIYEAEFYVENSFLDTENSCVCVPSNQNDNEIGKDDIFLIGRKIEAKYPDLRFTGKQNFEKGKLLFFYE